MNSNIFPLPFSTHVIFVAIAFVFFIIQFVRLKYKYQLVMAVAVAMSMLVYVNDSKMWFYGVGILEFGLLVLSFVLSIVEKKNKKETEDEESADIPAMQAVSAAEAGEE